MSWRTSYVLLFSFIRSFGYACSSSYLHVDAVEKMTSI